MQCGGGRVSAGNIGLNMAIFFVQSLEICLCLDAACLSQGRGLRVQFMMCLQSQTFATKKDVITAVCACTLAGQEAVVYSMSNCMFIQSGSPSVGGSKVKTPPFFHTVSIGMRASIGFRDGPGIMARFRDISHLHYNIRDNTVIVCEAGMMM